MSAGVKHVAQFPSPRDLKSFGRCDPKSTTNARYVLRLRPLLASLERGTAGSFGLCGRIKLNQLTAYLRYQTYLKTTVVNNENSPFPCYRLPRTVI
jgi:hypothetical protein